jgi:hypothetical protein
MTSGIWVCTFKSVYYLFNVIIFSSLFEIILAPIFLPAASEAVFVASAALLSAVFVETNIYSFYCIMAFNLFEIREVPRFLPIASEADFLAFSSIL